MNTLNHIDLRTLRYFLDVFEYQSFSDVARKENVSPSQVSRAIQQLEQALDMQLFYRNTRSIIATEAGRIFAQYIQSMNETLEESQRALHEQQQEPKGLIRLNASTAFASMHIAPHLAKLSERYPKLQIQLEQTDEFIDPFTEATDITFRISHLVDSSLRARIIAAQYYYIVASPQYIKRYGIPKTFEELTQHRCIAYKGKYGIDRWFYRKPSQKQWQQYRINPILTANNAETLYTATIAGIGLALLPDWIAYQGLENGSLVQILSNYETTAKIEPRHIAMLSLENRQKSLNVRIVMDYFIEVFGKPVYWQSLNNRKNKLE